MKKNEKHIYNIMINVLRFDGTKKLLIFFQRSFQNFLLDHFNTKVSLAHKSN